MHILWAPWRKTYIRGIKDSGCVFCNIQSDRNPDHKLIIYKGKYHFTVLNKFPYTPGHLMVVPFCHISRINELLPEALTEWWELTDKAINWLEKAFHPQGFNLGLNIGKIAGAGIQDHLHFHVVPRWQGDTNFMTSVHNTRIQSQSLEDICQELKQVI